MLINKPRLLLLELFSTRAAASFSRQDDDDNSLENANCTRVASFTADVCPLAQPEFITSDNHCKTIGLITLLPGGARLLALSPLVGNLQLPALATNATRMQCFVPLLLKLQYIYFQSIIKKLAFKNSVLVLPFFQSWGFLLTLLYCCYYCSATNVH